MTLREALLKHSWQEDMVGPHLVRVDDAIDALRQWLANEGLVVVPKSLTEEMTQALWFEISCVHPDQGFFRRGSENTVWRHTLAAAPDALAKDATT